MSLAEEIASWVVRTSSADIPAEAIEAANVSCFDCLGVALRGSKTPLGQKLMRCVQAWGGNPQCSIIGDRGRTAAPHAAMINGAFAHSMDLDNAGGFGHPAAVLFPALLAVGERGRLSGQALLEAYVVGCEVGLALFYNGGRAENAYRQMETGLHATSVFGRMAAAAACAKLLGLDQRDVAAALGIAASGATGLVSNFGTMTKALHAGWAARDGVIAVDLASLGWTSSLDSVEQPVGFMTSFFGDRSVDHKLVAASLSKAFRSPVTYAIRQHPTCGFNSPINESLAKLVREERCSPDEIDEVEILMDDSPSEILLYDVPKTALEAKFSARYNAAVTLLGRQAILFESSDERACDPAILHFMDKIKVRRERLGERERRARRGGIPVRVRLRNGEILEGAIPLADVEGSATRPLSAEQLAAKFRSNALEATSPAHAEELLETWIDLRKIADLSTALTA